MDYPNSLLDAMLMEFMGCIISGNYYTNILSKKEKKEMDELTDLKDKIVDFIAFNNSTKDIVIKKLLYLLDSLKELNKKNDTNPYIDWAGDTRPEYKRVTYYLRYTVKNNIVKMKYHKYYEAKRKEKYFIVYIRTDNLESAIKFDGDDRSIPSSVWTCLDNFFILSGKEEYVFCDAVDTVIREANNIDK